ncbi:hypothetical protein H0H92_015705, partial [Tricholoma furcatifolium]
GGVGLIKLLRERRLRERRRELPRALRRRLSPRPPCLRRLPCPASLEDELDSAEDSESDEESLLSLPSEEPPPPSSQSESDEEKSEELLEDELEDPSSCLIRLKARPRALSL